GQRSHLVPIASDCVLVEDTSGERTQFDLEPLAIAQAEIGKDTAVAVEDMHPVETLGDDLGALPATNPIEFDIVVVIFDIVVVVVVNLVQIGLGVPEPAEEEAEPLVPVTPALLPGGVELPFALGVVLPLLVDRDALVASLRDLVVGRVF